jgi:hypothetical protein
MSSVAVVRSALLVFGANAVSFYVAIPLWLPVSLAWGGEMNSLGVVGGHVILGFIVGLSAAVAGAIAGWAVEAGSSRWWGAGLSVLVAIGAFERERFRVPNRDYLVGLSLEALIGAGLAFVGFLFGEHLRLRREARDASSPVAA